tara:strand:- start:179 stop:568 length:390 start_codon:yes stop_codon:yes gene_type:complete
VFSVVNNSDSVIEKVAQCNNCGILHRVFEIGKSEILMGDEDGTSSILSKEDIKLMLPTAVSQVLETYSAELPIWEQCLFIVENKMWDNQVIITKETNDDNGTCKGKLMTICQSGNVKLETFVDSIYIER